MIDGYDDYKNRQEELRELEDLQKEVLDLKKELRKRWERIEKLAKALEFYADKSNLEKYVWQKEHYNSWGSWTDSGLTKEITRVAEEALK